MAERVMVVFGTRPECIKLAPVVAELNRRPRAFSTIVCSTGQHREMLDQALASFDLATDLDLEVMQPNQTLPGLTAALLMALSGAITELQPDRVIVQGDTTTAFAAALAAYYARVPVAHVEAGLRSGDRHNPFPEEINRRMVGPLADLHFAPTKRAFEALRSEGIAPATIHLTGNTIVDALHMLKARLDTPGGLARISAATRAFGEDGRRLILVTCHRRENFGDDLAAICRAVARIAQRHPDCLIVFPVHLNPNVRAQVMPLLSGQGNIALCEPVSYDDLIYLLSRATLVLSDSGGIQEEAPSFGVPVLVLRRTTERPEGIEAGVAELVGADEDLIVARAAFRLGDDAGRLRVGANPYGDGRAAGAIADILERPR
ncbi:UDP-N-acetylglucosamine 2-epimerase (non-hydrolyzing) [Rhodopseudomonas palustris]|uniref:non-hydrolyzing UDP-N-acetylglucosamine 2-epimerase n=1 Tax=Rhodopseudomonas palustris TaxID=1076 RepID=UPI002ACEF3FD|nr:UDP-N-acetylglucosamine 2-epimerase (non-hydrolyzing) [Rhodopseudomonas palustris]WQG97467.1 UDP-N-acetylglucosamine 2-epimerase (non-hydrolyzing) [Rhodopseudomonas palustris]